MTLIVVVVLSIVLVWLVTYGNIKEPGRTIIIVVLALAILMFILRLLGIW